MDLTEIEKRLTKLEDQERIRKLHQKYISFLDNLQFDKVLDLFTDAATVEVRTYGVHKGKNEIAAFYSRMAESRGNIKEGHMVVQPDISVEGDKATGSYMIFILFSKPSVEWVEGRNDCEYVKENGKWRISKLKFARINASKADMFP